MPAAGALFALLVVASIVGTIGLWAAIDRETDDSETMSRGDAERAARQDTVDAGEGGGDDRDGDEEAAEWGSDADWGGNESR